MAKDDFVLCVGDPSTTSSRGGLCTPKKLGLGLAGLLVAALLSVRVVLPAHVGISVVFGNVKNELHQQGIAIVNPFARMIQFSLKTQLLDQVNHVPTKEGLTVELDVAVLYHIDPQKAREVYLKLGPEFREVVMKPEIASAVRGLTSEAEAKALYTAGRLEMQKKLKEELVHALSPRGIVIEDVLLKHVVLPSQLTHSIELKAQMEQDSARMQFVLSKEKQEAQRKSIEATGIADFQKIISTGLTPELLQWKGIEATLKLGESANSKIVIMGNSKESLPVILSGDTAADKKAT